MIRAIARGSRGGGKIAQKEEEDSVQKIKELQEQGKILYTELTAMRPGRKSSEAMVAAPSLKWKKCAAKRILDIQELMTAL